MNIRKEDYELNQNEDVERIIFNRDKFLLEMSMHVYDESEKTFENLDLKISTMIASLGTLMTIQGSIFIYLLTEFIRNNSIYINISLVIVMLISLLSYTY